MEGASRRVAVVGAGPAGLASCRFLLERGFEPVVFEMGGSVGGIWAPDAPNKVVYRGLVTNLPTVAMQSLDLPFQSGLTSYVKGSDLGEYFAAYARHFDLLRHIRFGTKVAAARPLRPEAEEEGGAARWALHVEGPGGAGVEEVSAVVVAKGHYDEPYVPELPGQAEWIAGGSGRRVMHARDYDDPAELAGRGVLVVGGRSSAVDIARELRPLAAGLYVLEGGCSRVHAVGTCTHLPLGAALRADGFMEVEGRVVPGPPVDTVVLATGYTYTFPFLDSADLGMDFGPHARYVAPLYQHVVHAQRPSLCFVGVPLAVPVPLLLFEAQARFAVAHLAALGSETGRAAAPAAASSREQREAWLRARFAAVGGRPQDLHFMSGDAWDYVREMTRSSGLPEREFEVYSRRLAVVAEIYMDRVKRRPALPWDDDAYRRCEYSVDWEKCTWQVVPPADAAADSPARL